ncbi:MAG: class I SAM-dependent methyltransferase [Micrococcales bacterium]
MGKVTADYWDDKYKVEEFVYTKIENRFVVEYCSELKPGRVIDLAGGEGRNSVWFAKRGWTVENIDFSSVALQKYAAYAEAEGVARNCLATVSDALEFVPQLNEVELGVIGYLQIPGRDLRKAIRRLAKHVVPGGHLFGVWHARANLAGGFGGPRDPRVLPTVGFLKRALWGQGFEVLECRLRDGQIQTKEGLKPSITVVLLARKRA